MPKFIKYCLSLVMFLLVPFLTIQANEEKIIDKTLGRTVINVDSHGEAWFVLPDKGQRYYMGNPWQTWQMMKQFGVPISNQELSQIPVGIIQIKDFSDSDGDGLWDGLEKALGINHLNVDTDNDGYSDGDEVAYHYNPLGNDKLLTDQKIINKYRGKIIIQKENDGQAWYVFAPDNKRYYLGRPDEAFKILTGLGLGITAEHLAYIPIGTSSFLPPSTQVQSANFYLGEYSIGTDELVFKLEQGKDLEIIITNNGASPHELVFEELGISTGVIAPGQSRLIRFDKNSLKINHQYKAFDHQSADREKGLETKFRFIP